MKMKCIVGYLCVLLLICFNLYCKQDNSLIFQNENSFKSSNQSSALDLQNISVFPYDLKYSEKNISGNTGFGSCIDNAGDVNGDGYDDLIVSANQYNCPLKRVYIFYGGSLLDSIADVILNSEYAENNFGSRISSAGDINNDGFDDILIADNSIDNNTGEVYIYFGGLHMDSIPDITLKGEGADNYFGTSVSYAGDLNNDGVDDVIVGASSFNNKIGRSYIFFGGITLDNCADIILEGEETGSLFGCSVSYAGDVNNDGVSDVIVGAYGYFNNVGRGYVYFGGSSMDSIPDIIMQGKEPGDKFGYCVSTAGDINNDKTDDVMVGAIGRGSAYIFLGRSTMDSIAAYELFGDIGPEDWEFDHSSTFGRSIACAGDINNDGIDDIIVGGRDTYFYAHSGNRSANRTYLFYGGTYLHTANLKIYFGTAVSCGGDYNSDGIDDIVIGDYRFNYYSKVDAQHRNINTGRVNFYFGGSTMNNTSDFSLYGEGTDNEFSNSVSSAGDVNNDGFDDIIIGANGYGERTGKAFIYLGGNTIEIKPDIIMEGGKIHNRFGISVSSAGDVNNDGYDDVLVGADNTNWFMDYWAFEMEGPGAVFLYYGGNPMDSIADIVFNGEGYATADRFGYYTSSMGDVNHDGFDDIFIGANTTYNKRGYLYFGGTTMDNIPDKIFYGDLCGSSGGDVNGDGKNDLIVGTSIYFGDDTLNYNEDITMNVSTLSKAGDLNKDGYDDLISLSTENAYIYFGSDTLDSIPDVILEGGTTISSIGDFNKDGFDDVMVGSTDYNTSTGKALLYFGGETMDSIADIVFEGEEYKNYFGCSLSAGDFNSDGYKDIVIGANKNQYNGAAYLYYGKQIIQFMKHPINKTLCEKDTALFSIIADNTSDYQWQVSSDSGKTFVDVENNEIYTGSSSPEIHVVAKFDLTNTIYRCKATNNELISYSHCALLTVNKRPTSVLIGGDTVCVGDSTKVSIQFSGKSPWNFQLSNGSEITNEISYDSLITFYVDSTITYSIISLNDANCIGVDTAGESVVIVNPLPTSNLSGEITICEGDTAFLTLDLTGLAPWSFILSDGKNSKELTTFESQNFIPIDSAGFYRVIEIYDSNCNGRDLTGEGIIYVNPLPTGILCGENEFCLADSVEICVYLTGTPPWNFTVSDGTYSSEYSTNDVPYYFILDSVGTYYIGSVSDANCSSQNTCGQIKVNNCSGLNEIITNNFSIYPNPSNGMFSINNLPLGTKIIITSISGQTIYSNEVNSNRLDIDLSASNTGIYLLKFITDNKIQISKIIVE